MPRSASRPSSLRPPSPGDGAPGLRGGIPAVRRSVSVVSFCIGASRGRLRLAPGASLAEAAPALKRRGGANRPIP
ncbi:hypothetical protein MOX02_44240 [Methylobacterium oxalidis]|uniref:Uncharacterized protein n=1 Tax=Methylobacterium oxalidis TaxID=944322 RepID=A0A512J8V5_9HYPH|nr:hypothetical protein MOX02_44240 [Methylobacterium oxalidis]GLS63109.1 hypothetical protein GCM10007888_14900 [Methylobacterium oxalidis]